MRRRLLALGLAGLAAMATARSAAGQSLADYDYEYLGFRGIGVDAGYVWANKVTNTEQLSLRLDLGYLGPGVRIIPSVSFWQSEFTAKELGVLADRFSKRLGVPLEASDLGPLEWSDLSLSVDGQMVWNTPLDVLGFVGAGVGFHALNGQGALIDDTFIEDLLDVISVGAAFLGGLEYEVIDRLRVYGEGRFTLMNSVHYLSARAGLQFMFRVPGPQTVGAVPAAPPAGAAP